MSDSARLHDSTSGGEAQTVQVAARAKKLDGEVQVGTTVSRYVVLDEVGRGAMGRVLRGYDPKLQREVALKEVRGDALGEDATRRLVGEARAMAKLSHPNVVAVYDVEELSPDVGADAGNTGSRVVLVMEFVAGQTLRRWLHDTERGWREVVASFVAAGNGLAAAHAAGLLHRDFKPANVLVGGDTVKVTDFGLAKMNAGESSAIVSGSSWAGEDPSESRTELGKVMGTPRYMAPEQHRGEVLTAAADQYAFCVALWEALCGAPPFRGKTMARDKGAGPPQWPSGATPRPVAEAILRGLSARPSDRWPGMEALLSALSWDPARRRTRWLLGLGTLGGIGVATVSHEAWTEARVEQCRGARENLVGIWDEARRAEVERGISRTDRPYARGVWLTTQRDLDAYAERWVQMHTDACEATAVRGEQSPRMLDLRMGCLGRAAAELRAAVDILADADERVVQGAHELTAGLRPLARCADTEALAAEVEPPLSAEADAVERAREELVRAAGLEKAGRYGRAFESVEAAQRVLAGVEYGPARAEAALVEGEVLDQLGRYEDSEMALRRALRLASKFRQWNLMRRSSVRLMMVVGSRQRRMVDALQYQALADGLSAGWPRAEVEYRNSLGAIFAAQGKYEEAEVEYRAALRMQHDALASDLVALAAIRDNLGSVLRARGKHEDAEAQHRAALSLRERHLTAGHPEIAASRKRIALALHEQGMYLAAEAGYRAVLSVQEKSLGPGHPEVALTRSILANVLLEQGRDGEAEAEYRVALPLMEKALGLHHPEVASSRGNLAVVLARQQKNEQAEAELRAVLSVREQALGLEHPAVAMSRQNLGNIHLQRHQYEEAESEFRLAMSQYRKALGSDHPDVASARNNLAVALEKQGKYREAEVEYRAALAAWEEALGPEHPDVARAQYNLGEMLFSQGRLAEARALAEQAWATRQREDIAKDLRGITAFLVSQILWSIDGSHRDRVRARKLAQDALQALQAASEPDDAKLVQQWLDDHPL